MELDFSKYESGKFKFKIALQNLPNIACRLTCCHVPFKGIFSLEKHFSVSSVGSRGNTQLTQTVGLLHIQSFLGLVASKIGAFGSTILGGSQKLILCSFSPQKAFSFNK
jgi:hypothetical protein